MVAKGGLRLPLRAHIASVSPWRQHSRGDQSRSGRSRPRTSPERPRYAEPTLLVDQPADLAGVRAAAAVNNKAGPGDYGSGREKAWCPAGDAMGRGGNCCHQILPSCASAPSSTSSGGFSVRYWMRAYASSESSRHNRRSSPASTSPHSQHRARVHSGRART